MRNYIIVALTIATAGCAAKIVSSTAQTVVISASASLAQEAQVLAEQECARHAKHARMIHGPSPLTDHFVFECIP